MGVQGDYPPIVVLGTWVGGILPSMPYMPCFTPLGAEIRSVCTEAGMFAIRARRKVATEKDFLDAITKVIKGYAKFSATPRYLTHN